MDLDLLLIGDEVFIDIDIDIMASFRAACMSPEFTIGINAIDSGLREQLDSVGVLRPTVFSKLVRHAPGTQEAADAFAKLVTGSGASPEQCPDWVNQCLRLHAIATEAAPEIHERIASRTGFEVSLDLLE